MLILFRLALWVCFSSSFAFAQGTPVESAAKKMERQLKNVGGYKEAFPVELHRLGEALLCMSRGRSGKEAQIRKLVKSFRGSLEKVSYRDFSGRTEAGGEYWGIKVTIDDTASTRLEVEGNKFSPDGEERLLLKIRQAKDGGVHNRLLVSQTFYDSSCSIVRSVVLEYNKTKLWRRFELNSESSITRTIYADRRVLPLEEIYTAEELVGIRQRLSEVKKLGPFSLITILDFGVDYNHPGVAYKIQRPDYLALAELSLLYFNEDLPENQRPRIEQLQDVAVGWDFHSNDSEPYDNTNPSDAIWSLVDNHGTHISGIATQGTDVITILPIRISATNRTLLYDAIAMAHRRGSRIVNISLGSTDRKEWADLGRAMEDFSDILFVVAAGNDSVNIAMNQSFPASFTHENMLVVTSVDADNSLSSFSNFSISSVDLGALGKDVYSLIPEGQFGEKPGSSMAVAQVSRTAGKILFINPSLGPLEIIEIIKASVEPVSALRAFLKFGGVLDEDAALILAKESLEN